MKVCSKLPHALLIENPLNPNETVEIKGVNSETKFGIQLEEFATTEVNPDFWGAWIAVHKDFPAIKSGAIFVAKDDKSAQSIAKEYTKRKSGFERLKPDEHGVKKADFSKND